MKRILTLVLVLVTLMALVGGCGPQATPTPEPTEAPTDEPADDPTEEPTEEASEPEPVTLVIMAKNNFDPVIEEYMGMNPHVTIERVERDDNKLAAMFAANEAPCLIHKSGADTRVFETRGWIMDLTPYFESSDVLKPEDMVEAVEYFKTEDGWYGMHKDWSLDSALVINKRMTDEAGIELPPPNSIITYDQLAEWAPLLLKQDAAGRVETMALSMFSHIDGPLQNILAEKGENLYADDFSEAYIKDNETVEEVLRFAVDLAERNLIWNPLTPNPAWYAPNMLDGKVAIISSGFWVNMSFANAEDPAEDPANFVMYPAASWTGETVVDRSMGGAGLFISSQCEHPDEAWGFFEYYMGGQPAVDRAKGGWGLPALKSLMDLVPAETDWQQQWLETVEWELESDQVIKTPRRINPYCPTTIMNNVWQEQLELYLKDQATFDELVEAIDTEVNECIADGIEAAGE